MAQGVDRSSSSVVRFVLCPLPDRDFDVTEVAVPWRLLTRAGHRIVFCTERGPAGPPPAADPLLLRGVLFGQLGAAPEARAFYHEMEADPAFQHPRAWEAMDPAELHTYDALLLPGGHAPGMRQYLGSPHLQALVSAFFQLDRPVAAICHGVLLAARSLDPPTGRNPGRSVLYDRRTTCLPKYMERTAYLLTFWKLGNYYRTYPAYVEDEVRAALRSPAQFQRGPRTLTRRDTASSPLPSPLAPSTGSTLSPSPSLTRSLAGSPAFVVRDGNYLSARWPGDAYTFAQALLAMLPAAS